jgi:23S rRNA pseudouridine2457 synthase
MSAFHYYILHKPYNMLSQFISTKPGNVLAMLPYTFPDGIHAIGRLDNESEGLLLLTTDKRITKLLFKSKQKHTRTYWVKVDGIVQDATLLQLQSGVTIRIRGGDFWATTACTVSIIDEPKNLVAIEERLYYNGTNTWLQITLTEGKYRQIRKMVAAVGHKCKRLIRVAIDDLHLGDIASGEVVEVSEAEFFEKLHLN